MQCLWDYLAAADKPLVMYGTGDGADKIINVLEQYGLKPSAFTASDEFARGQNFRGFKVKRLDETERELSDFIILVCFGTSRDDVIDRLIELSERREVYAPDVPVTGDEIFDAEFAEKNAAQLNRARSLLSDERSREVFDGWLSARLNGKIREMEAITDTRENALNLLNMTAAEYYVDLGAYDGDTIEEFLNFTGKRFTKIIAVEPDKHNYAKMKRRFFRLGWELFRTVNACAHSENGVVKFIEKTGRGGYQANASSGTKPVRGREIAVPSVTIDSLCGEDVPTLMKFDVEGGEAEALKGAANVIKKHKPRLIVSAYHRSEDMFALPLLISSLNPRYKIYLRRQRCIPCWETNFYCV